MTRSPKSRKARLSLESFDDRIVPAVVDLTTTGASGVANGAIFQQFDAPPGRPSGASTFLRVDANGVEQGYNTDGKGQKFGGGNDFSGRAIQLSQIPLVTAADGTQYRAFNVDVREPGRNPTVSLDELRIYFDSNRKLNDYDSSSKTLGGKAAVWDMDAAGDSYVMFNADLNARRTKGDAFVYIPNSAFSGAADTDYVFLYSKFGLTAKANGGAESWLVRPAPTPPSQGGGGGGTSISGSVFYDQIPDGKLSSSEGDFGLDGVTIELWAADSFGNPIGTQPVATAITMNGGQYSFANLNAGNYLIKQVHAPNDMDMPQVGGFNLINGGDWIGIDPPVAANTNDTYNTTTDAGADYIAISLGTGQTASNYNFTMVQDISG